MESKTGQVGIFVYLFLCTASHGVLDALTNGGLCAAFFLRSVQDDIFLGSPVAVSPIGINDFFSEDAFHALASEVNWIWLPTIAGFFITRGLLNVWSAPTPTPIREYPYGRYLCNSPPCEISYQHFGSGLV